MLTDEQIAEIAGKLTEARSMVEAAAASIGAVRSEYPGLWNAPGYPELTTGEVLDMARRNYLENSRGTD